MKVIVIPGNPPVEHYYEEWKKELLELGGIREISISYFPLFSETLNSNEYMEMMISFYEAKLKEFAADDNVIVIGHSIGGTFALEVLKRNPELVNKCFLFFPFLSQPTWKGKLTLEFAHYVNKSKLAKDFVFKHIDKLHRFIPELRPVTIEELETCVRLAAHERKTVGRIKRHEPIKKELHRDLHIYYCDGDNWFSQKSVDDLHPEISCLKLDTRHDFIIDKQHRDLVTAEIKKALS
jgi:pimeloyl-ACP methyl ester carboxylesterase